MCPVLRALKSAAAQRAARSAKKERRTFDEELRDRDEAEDVHWEHALVVRVRDLADALDAEHEARVVHCSARELGAPGGAQRRGTHRGCRPRAGPRARARRATPPAPCPRRPAEQWRICHPVSSQILCMPRYTARRPSRGHLCVERRGSDSIHPVACRMAVRHYSLLFAKLETAIPLRTG